MDKVALVGCGYWGKNLGRVLHELGTLGAVCDTSEAARSVAESFGVPWIQHYDELLADRRIGALAIATPAVTHARFVREGLAAGKDVFVEKPIALDLREAEGLAETARNHDRILMVGHLLQYHPAFLRLKALVDEGAIGPLRYVYSNRLNIGKLRREENVLWSFAPHDISMILALAGGNPQRVEAHGHAYLQKNIADSAIVHMTFKSGLQAHVHVSWLHPFKEQKLVVVGENAMMVFDDTKPPPEKLMLYRHRVEWNGDIPTALKADGERIAFGTSEPLRNELEHFIDCVRTREKPRTDAREAIGVLDVLTTAQSALDESYRVAAA